MIMKKQTNIFTRLTIIGLTVGALCLSGAAFGQAESKKKDDSAATQLAATTEATAKSPLDEKDKKFMRKAAKGGMMEVELGKMAAEHAKSDDVKAFGKRMVTDHSNANDELKAIAAKKGAKMPKSKETPTWTSDKSYIDMMVKDHEKDLAEFQEEAKEGTDPDLKAFAEKGAKMIEEHLNLAKETQGKLK